jgi:hypothetical protein
MNPSPRMGYAKRKPLTGNPYERFDEEAEAVRPLLYSTSTTLVLMLPHSEKVPE